MDIKYRNIYQFTNEERSSLIASLKKICKQYNLVLKKIFVVGSRCFKIPKSFTPDSDLDIILCVDNLDDNLKHDMIMFKGLKVNIKFYDIKDYEKKIITYAQYQTPYYDLLEKKYYKGNEIDTYDYLRNRKGRILKLNNCTICGNKANGYIVIKYKQINSPLPQERHWDICQECYDKYFGKDLKHLINKLEDNKNVDIN